MADKNEETDILKDVEIQQYFDKIVKDAAALAGKEATDAAIKANEADLATLQEMMVEKTFERLDKNFGYKEPIKKEFTFGDLVAKAH